MRRGYKARSHGRAAAKKRMAGLDCFVGRTSGCDGGRSRLLVPLILLLHLKQSDLSSNSSNVLGNEQDAMGSGVEGSILDGMSASKGAVVPEGMP